VVRVQCVLGGGGRVVLENGSKSCRRKQKQRIEHEKVVPRRQLHLYPTRGTHPLPLHRHTRVHAQRRPEERAALRRSHMALEQSKRSRNQSRQAHARRQRRRIYRLVLRHNRPYHLHCAGAADFGVRSLSTPWAGLGFQYRSDLCFAKSGGSRHMELCVHARRRAWEKGLGERGWGMGERGHRPHHYKRAGACA
jgi:hypothetical protein